MKTFFLKSEKYSNSDQESKIKPKINVFFRHVTHMMIDLMHVNKDSLHFYSLLFRSSAIQLPFSYYANNIKYVSFGDFL